MSAARYRRLSVGGIRALLLLASALLVGCGSTPLDHTELMPAHVAAALEAADGLALIAYRFAIGASLPPVSYLTRMDWFILLSTVLVYASLVAVIVTALLERRGSSQLAKGVDQISRWGIPLFFLIPWVLIAVVA